MPDNRSVRLYWLHCLSPTHVGIGRGLGYIDLPIDRDTVTGWPIIRGSAFKGVLADRYCATNEARQHKPELRAAFGLGGESNVSNSGAIMPTDARLVCLPIRSFRGTFSWATSPLCLQMLHRTLTLAGIDATKLPSAPTALADDTCHVSEPSALVEQSHVNVAGANRIEQKVFLEDLDFKATACPTATSWASTIASFVFEEGDKWRTYFQNRFVVVPDLAFDFLCETGTEVHTRVRIDDETKVVTKGALWTEESLPAETILMGVIQCDRVFCNHNENGQKITPKDLLDKYATEPITLQIGGKATIGRGQVYCRFTEVS